MNQGTITRREKDLGTGLVVEARERAKKQAPHGVTAVSPVIDEAGQDQNPRNPESSVKRVKGEIPKVEELTSQKNEKPSRFSTVSAFSLMAMEFPEPEWLVDGLLPYGLAILAGRPKQGKSWFALNLAVSIANGSQALGKYGTTQGETLYLALEDNHRRLQKRISQIQVAERIEIPENLHFLFSFKRLDEGGVEDLRDFLEERPRTKFIIIDTLAKVRGRKRLSETYGGDYQELGELQSMALEYGVAILLVHHTTKNIFDDPFDSISGTSAISGAADTLFVLVRESGGVNLYTRGRDIDDGALGMNLDPTSGIWSVLGDASEAWLSPERKKILTLLSDGKRRSPKEIADEVELPRDNVRQLLRKMLDDNLLDKGNGVNGKYGLPVHSDHTDHRSSKVLKDLEEQEVEA